MTDMTIANTIRDQIGRPACAMIGAKNFVGGKYELSFKIGRNPKRVSHIRVRLSPDDLYEVEFIRVRGIKVETVKEWFGVHAESLLTVIESSTGLRTSL